ncbi:DNA-binding MarR family transcriptional regulator [Knoellia remsis]|uniref:DNA-binding MarR family transcriptional regulator n=1 Tax=Knoellia remsis TaxID=407159 RepID=A0A2T0UMX1_9MICO|nr:MarR family transcriptional regulator [Knoellia remsis]PRY59275.1 DNA-binding MarR family transcriptional regulator [Knoellia remsis]
MKGSTTTPATPLDDDALAAGWRDLMQRYQRLSCTLDRTLMSEHELTSSEFNVLEALCVAEPAELKMADLGTRVHLTQSALSRLVGRLEEAGLVHREMCPKDRRAVFARVTDSGRARYAEARPTQRSVLRAEVEAAEAPSTNAFLEACAALPADPADSSSS